ncbi:hypothetical protein QJS10_CPA07g00733 [Acorus calamus]|uniref:Uncharacterized protein n=1 Tax=Acorus calamus TaxID=4465 RepID=A0AAV9EIA2_ACOCL|nr:hypothetical protein QJS10_CPA07g00733 [Acorus calamus]
MLRLWKWYQKSLAVHPVKTQVISSWFLWGLGDVTAQAITHSSSSVKNNKSNNKFQDRDDEFKINWRRAAVTSMFGFSFVGPIGHLWYERLDRFMRLRLQLQPKTMRFVAAKVAADGIIFGPIDLLLFFSYMGLATGKSVPQVKEDVKRDFFPALIVGGGTWMFVQMANFRYIPVRYQLLYVNIFCLLDSSFLSWVEQQGDASWKQWFIKSSESLEEQKKLDR